MVKRLEQEELTLNGTNWVVVRLNHGEQREHLRNPKCYMFGQLVEELLNAELFEAALWIRDGKETRKALPSETAELDGEEADQLQAIYTRVNRSRNPKMRLEQILAELMLNLPKTPPKEVLEWLAEQVSEEKNAVSEPGITASS